MKPCDILEPARWPSGPPICLHENLPAFQDEATMKRFQQLHLSNVKREWKCDRCGCWHYTASVRPPSGESNGTTREVSVGHAEPVPRKELDCKKVVPHNGGGV